MNLLVLTSYLFILPFLGAINKKEYFNSLAYLLLLTASVLCHTSDEYCNADIILAWIVILINLVYIISNYKTKTSQCNLSMICAIFGFILYLYCKYYTIYYYYLHSLWHVIVSVGSFILYM